MVGLTIGPTAHACSPALELRVAVQIVLEYSPGAWEVNQKWEEYPMIAGMLDLCAPIDPERSLDAHPVV